MFKACGRVSGDDRPTRDTDAVPLKKPLRRPISPFKVNKPPSQHTDEQAPPQNIDLSRLSRAQLLQAALKVALESGSIDGLPAFQRAGPISPFRPGTRGFSAVGQRSNTAGRRNYTEDTDTSTLISESSTSQSTMSGLPLTDVTLPKRLETADDAVRVLERVLSDSVAELHIPDQPVKTTAKSTNRAHKTVSKSESSSAALQRKTTRNKKIPQVAAKKKTKVETPRSKRVAKPTASQAGVGQNVAGHTSSAASHDRAKRPARDDHRVSEKSDTARSHALRRPRAAAAKINSDSESLSSTKPAALAKGSSTISASDRQNKASGTAAKMAVDVDSKQGTSEKENRSTTTDDRSRIVKPVRTHEERRVGQEIVDTGDNIIDDDVIENNDDALTSAQHDKYHSLFAQIKHLTRELKAVPGIKLDKEGIKSNAVIKFLPLSC